MWKLWPYGSQFWQRTQSWTVKMCQWNSKWTLLQPLSIPWVSYLAPTIRAHSYFDYDVLLVCVHHMMPCQVYVPREEYPELWVSPLLALVDLWQLYALILCVVRIACSSWECTITSVEGDKVSKSKVCNWWDFLVGFLYLTLLFVDCSVDYTYCFLF